MTSSPASAPVTMLGLGAMGAALGHALVDAGHDVVVWNRTSARTAPLVAAGARAIDDVADAIAASPLIVACLLDAGAMDAVLGAAGDLHGRTVVNLTSSTPEDARRLAQRIRASGGRAIDGTVMVPTPLVGTEHTFVLYAGDADAYHEHAGTLSAFGGEAELLGDDAGLAAVLDLGMLDVFYAGMSSFLHAAAMVGADGVSATAFAPYAHRMVELLHGTIDQLALDVDAGAHPGTEDTVAMNASFLRTIVSTSEARDVDATLPRASLALAERAIAAGRASDGWSRVIDALRAP